MSKVFVSLHGGLGNQLFQFFFACTTKGCRGRFLWLVTDLLHRYNSARSMELLPLVESRLLRSVGFSDPNFVLQLRVPKVLAKITGHERIIYVPGLGAIVDGYFQKYCDYQNVPDEILRTELADWRNVLSERLRLNGPASGRVMHLRLSDFFNDSSAARAFVGASLAAISGPTDLVTDQESFVAGELAKFNFAESVRLLPTSGMNAWDLMALMCRYELISTNGSTLAFWASVIRGSQFQSTNNDHVAIWLRLLRATETAQLREQVPIRS